MGITCASKSYIRLVDSSFRDTETADAAPRAVVGIAVLSVFVERNMSSKRVRRLSLKDRATWPVSNFIVA